MKTPVCEIKLGSLKIYRKYQDYSIVAYIIDLVNIKNKYRLIQFSDAEVLNNIIFFIEDNFLREGISVKDIVVSAKT